MVPKGSESPDRASRPLSRAATLLLPRRERARPNRFNSPKKRHPTPTAPDSARSRDDRRYELHEFMNRLIMADGTTESQSSLLVHQIKYWY